MEDKRDELGWQDMQATQSEEAGERLRAATERMADILRLEGERRERYVDAAVNGGLSHMMCIDIINRKVVVADLGDFILLTEREQREVQELTWKQWDSYCLSRAYNGQSHNMAMILVTREGPAGRVAGSSTPCPKRASRPAQKLTNIRRKYRGGTIQDL